MTQDLFDAHDESRIRLGEQACVLRGFARDWAEALLSTVAAIEHLSPLRHLQTPGGYTMSVAMTNCGALGWVSDRRGYRYAPLDPLTGRAWPPLPALFLDLAGRAAEAGGFAGFMPDACLINEYRPGTRLALHQDRDERDFSAPIVSVSLGMSAVFLFGGHARSDRAIPVPLAHGDVVVWGGVDRLRFHGVRPLRDVPHPLVGSRRINLTFRKAG